MGEGNLSIDILSELVIYMKYARYLPNEKRRETWEELVTRCRDTHIRKFPELRGEIEEAFKSVYEKKVLPSARSLQFGGKPIEISPNRLYNCSATAIDHWQVFSETMFLLLGGSGVGYSVQAHHVDKLPEIKARLKRKRRFLISDSIEGWADAIKVLMKSYFYGQSTISFDYSDIRPKGAPLITSGGKAPGPQPLHDCIHHIEAILKAKEPGTKLTPLECHDIICHISDAVLSGGIRRAACIALFSMDDEEMMSSKYGQWYERNPQRGRANNSTVVLRHKITKKRFFELWERVKLGEGDPGIFLSNCKESLTNPCAEISLRNPGFCNLTTVNLSDVEDQADFNYRVEQAAKIGTLQASYTDFHYLRSVWQRNAERDSLIGVGLTGVASEKVLELDLKEAADLVVETNKEWAEKLGIKPAARTTTMKPSGTSSLVVGSSSGVHAWYAKYYIRRMQVLKTEPIYKYLKKTIPELIEDDYFQPSTQAIIFIPVKAPEDAITRDEPIYEQLERIKRFNIEWVRQGHISGENTNNVSATVFVKEEEWDMVGRWMWENRQYYNGITILPYEGGNHKQAPHEEITEEKYNELVKHLKKLDLSKISEYEDNTNLKEQVACSGSVCDIL